MSKEEKIGKKHTTITIDKEIYDWIKKQIKRKRFSSISHAVEYCVFQIMEKEKKKEGKKFS